MCKHERNDKLKEKKKNKKKKRKTTKQNKRTNKHTMPQIGDISTGATKRMNHLLYLLTGKNIKCQRTHKAHT